jgi:hypothetical protein
MNYALNAIAFKRNSLNRVHSPKCENCHTPACGKC